ncbi:hypothetical protein [Actinoallomurus acaciae]|uniref:Uncharacterized protein n=1 Tax=Actinoallomurus acaciae TaxID=502577 RepID=A0ABV5Y8L0_9ACTN
MTSAENLVSGGERSGDLPDRARLNRATRGDDPVAGIGRLLVDAGDSDVDLAALQAEFWLYAMRDPERTGAAGTKAPRRGGAAMGGTRWSECATTSPPWPQGLLRRRSAVRAGTMAAGIAAGGFGSAGDERR